MSNTLHFHRGRTEAIRLALSDLDPYFLVILFLPILVVLRDSNAAFTPVGNLDPWFYFGYFHNLVAFEHDLFPATYYGGRLSWILPGYVINAIFSPLVANYVLHFGVFYLAAVSLFFTLKRTVDRHAAILSVIALTFYPYFWAAIGSDYVDGVGIAYYLLTTALLTYSADLDNERLGLVLAGTSFAALLYSNATWAMYAPFFPMYYLWLRMPARKTGWPSVLWRFVICFGSGFVLVTAILAVINYRIAGYFWFYRSSVAYSASAFLKRNPWKAPDYSWVKRATWLVLPGITVLIGFAAALSVRMRLRPKRHAAMGAFLGNFLYLAVLLTYLEIRGGAFLQYIYYVSYLIPPMFLVLGSYTFRVAKRFPRKWSMLWVPCVVLIFAIPWWDMSRVIPHWLAKVPPLGLLGLLVGATLAATVYAGRRTVLLPCLVCFSLFNAYIGTVGLRPANAGRDAYMRIARSLGSIENIRAPAQWLSFWFDVHEPYGPEFDSFNSTFLWGYTGIGREFPALQAELNVPVGTLVVVPSSRGDLSSEAQWAFMRKDLGLRRKAATPIHYGNGGYSLAFLEVTATPGNLQPLRLSLDSKTGIWRWTEVGAGEADSGLPVDRWTADDHPNPGSRLQHLPAGVRVVATPGSSKYAVLYGPLQAPTDGGYLFRLRIQTSSGSPHFGVMDREKGQWLVPTPVISVQRDYQYQECSLVLHAAQPFWLAVPAEESEFLIEEMRAYRYKNE